MSKCILFYFTLFESADVSVYIYICVCILIFINLKIIFIEINQEK